MDKVSIITPNFNRADLIQETAASIFNQTNPNWEWIVVDDGSTDNSLQVMKELAAKDERVKIFERDRLPKGACTCRNIAIENSSAKFLIFLDSDDVLASFCVEQRLKAAKENPECDFLIFPLLLFKNKPGDKALLWNIENETDDLTRVLIGDPICQGTGTIWRKDSFIKIGKWDENLLLWQDIELHLRTFLKRLNYKKLINLPPDIFIRISEVSMSRTGFNSLPKFQSRMKVFSDTLILAKEKKVFFQYRTGLAKMGFDLICSGINSNHFVQAKQLLNFAEQHNLFTTSEIKNLKIYYWSKKLRLYKLPLLKNFSLRPTISHFNDYVATINEIEYTKSIIS